MAFFDELGKKVTQVSQGAIQKTKDMADVAKLNSSISDEEKKIQNLYNVIGKLYFDMHENNCEEPFQEAVMAIRTSINSIEELKEQIQKIKITQHCPSCGAEVMANTLFCGSCGCRLPNAQPVQQPAAGYAPSYGQPVNNVVKEDIAPETLVVETPVVETSVVETPVVVEATVMEPQVSESVIDENTQATVEEIESVNQNEEEIPVVQTIDAEEAMKDAAEESLTAETAIDFAASQAEDSCQDISYKFCGNCGCKMDKMAVFCPDCGTKCDE